MWPCSSSHRNWRKKQIQKVTWWLFLTKLFILEFMTVRGWNHFLSSCEQTTRAHWSSAVFTSKNDLCRLDPWLTDFLKAKRELDVIMATALIEVPLDSRWVVPWKKRERLFFMWPARFIIYSKITRSKCLKSYPDGLFSVLPTCAEGKLCDAIEMWMLCVANCKIRWEWHYSSRQSGPRLPQKQKLFMSQV